MRGLCSGIGSVALLGLVPGCKELNPDFDGPTSSSAGSSAATMPGPGSDTLTMTTSAGSMGGSATSADGTSPSSSGVSPCQGDMCLTDRGLLVRYFIDESASG